MDQDQERQERQEETRRIPVEITYTLSEAGQRASLAAGGDGRREQVARGEIGPEDLGLLEVDQKGRVHRTIEHEVAAPYKIKPGYGIEMPPRIDAPRRYGVTWDQPQTVEALLDWLRPQVRARLEAETRLAAALAEARAAWEAEREAKIARNTQVAAERREAEERRRLWRLRQDRADEEAQARLRAWAEAHGTELLRARIEDGYDWQSLARREYCLGVLAAGAETERAVSPEAAGVVVEDRDRPDLEEIQAARRIEALDGVKSARVVLLGRAEDWTGYPETVSAVQAEIQAPDGQACEYCLPVEDVRPAA